MTQEQKKLRLKSLADELRAFRSIYDQHYSIYRSRLGLMGLQMIEKLDEINQLLKELEVSNV